MKTLRVEAVAAKIGIGVSTVWKFTKMNIGFPRPFKLGPQITVWDEADIDVWLQQTKGDQLCDETVGSQNG